MQKNIDYYFEMLQQNKKEKIFKKIYKLSSMYLFAVIVRILKNKEISEECMQEVYIKIWNNINNYNPEKSRALTWMSVIARNHALDYIRKHQLTFTDDFDINIIKDEQSYFLLEMERGDNSRQLNNCLKQLKIEHRNVIFMAYFNGHTYESIAKIVGSPVSTVKAWVFRSLPVLKKCLKES